MANKEDLEEREEYEDYSLTGYERWPDETDEDYQERMEDYESFVDYNND